MSDNDIDKEILKRLLLRLNISDLKALAYKKGMPYKGRSKNEVINNLLELKWSLKELEELKIIVRERAAKRSPISSYIVRISECNINILHTLLSKTEFAFKYDKEKRQLVKEGFDIIKMDDQGNKIISAYWYKTEVFRVTEDLQIIIFDEPRKIPFIIDCSENKIYVQCNALQDFQKLMSIFENKLKLKIEPYGPADLLSEDANKKFSQFINDLKERLEFTQGEYA